VARAGFALRVREQDGIRELQLKSLTPGQGAWHQRREMRWRLEDGISLDAWLETGEGAFLKAILDGRPLQPLFSIHQKRHEAPVLDPSGHSFALLSLDEVTWHADGNTARAWELEVELLPEEDAHALRAVQRALDALPGLTPQRESKYERGLQLLRGKAR
jgi:inorganic triphosphatase YgiF